MPSRTPFSSVVVATDFSDGAYQALTRALELPLGPKSKLTVLHVLPDDIPSKLRKPALAEADRSLEKTLARLRSLAIRKGLSPRQFVTDVVEGDAAHQIIKRAHTVEADVICLGRHGRRTLGNLLVGSTSRKVVKLSDVPVLLAKSAAAGPYRRGLIAVDLTRGSLAQLDEAARYLTEALTIEVLHAASVPYEEFIMLPAEQAVSFRAEALRSAQRELATLMKKARWQGATPLVLSGDARLLISEEARRVEAELVVVATHSPKGAKRLLLGSVAEWVLSNARCDVLVTRG